MQEIVKCELKANDVVYSDLKICCCPSITTRSKNLFDQVITINNDARECKVCMETQGPLVNKGMHRSIARIFQRGGGGGLTRCHTQGTYEIVLSTSTLCFTKSDFFQMSSERWAKEKPTK